MNNNDTGLKEELMGLYKEILGIRKDYIKKAYIKMFGNTDEVILSEFYKTFYAKQYMKPSFVYFIYNKYTKLMKIGKTNNPFKRLNELNSMFKNHFGIDDALKLIRIIFVPSGKNDLIEKMYHEKFNNYNKYGEWFDVSVDKIVEIIPEFFSYDTDGLIDNEGFDRKLKFKEPTDYEYSVFTLDTLDDYTLKLFDGNRSIALSFKKVIHNDIKKDYNIIEKGVLGFDTRLLEYPFSITKSGNKTWEMYKWLYLHQEEYSLSSHLKINEKGDITKRVIGFNNKNRILDYYEIIDEILSKL